MGTFFVVFTALGCLVMAYVLYGRYLARTVVSLKPDATVPSHEFSDGTDYVPTAKHIVFGHHFTSIAGTGPIVGPAIAVFWGWLPAMLWVVLGAIFIGGVHDFFSLVISLRNRGQTIGEVAGRLVSPRAKILFLIVLSLALWIVLAIFGLVIATIFAVYPESVLPVWIAMPMAAVIGWRLRQGRSLWKDASMALLVLYAAIWAGVYWLPIDLSSMLWSSESDGWKAYLNPVVVWTVILMAYCFLASVLPVWLLLQPRDYINSMQLNVAMVLILAGLCVACITGSCDLFATTEAISSTTPDDAPPIFPFLFITIACGACSGFHCLVSSGTTSKQISNERDAKAVGYGAMLLEGGLAVIVILACTAGVGMGALDHSGSRGADIGFQLDANGDKIVGNEAWNNYYRVSTVESENGEEQVTQGWAAAKLTQRLAAFIDGAANFLTMLGIPLSLGVGVVAVLVASFAATTLDTATRLHRYVIQEIGNTIQFKPMTGKYSATSAAVLVGLLIAVFAGSKPGTGGLLLWPLFGATNQLLAGLALIVATLYLWRRSKPIAVVALPMLVMLIVPAVAMSWDLLHSWWPTHEKGSWLLTIFGFSILGLQIWIIAEAALVMRRAYGVLEDPMPELERNDVAAQMNC